MISVVIPIFNVEKYLCRCVESVLQQSYSELEIILVNDGSTDSSGQLCDKLAKRDSRIRVIHRKNGGASAARNTGIQVSTGEYITFVDGDDFIEPDIYQAMLKAIAEKGQKVIVNMGLRLIDEFGKTQNPPDAKTEDCYVKSKEYLRTVLMHQNDSAVYTKLFPAKLIKNVSFREGTSNEDVIFMIDLLPLLEGIYFLKQVGYNYFIRKDSISRTYGKAVRDMVSNSIYIYEHVYNEYNDMRDVAFRFMLHQHMAYLFIVPREYRKDQLYTHTVALIRKNKFRALTNKYLTLRQKIMILMLVLFPESAANLRAWCKNIISFWASA